jgi:hypothetical protein
MAHAPRVEQNEHCGDTRERVDTSPEKEEAR